MLILTTKTIDGKCVLKFLLIWFDLIWFYMQQTGNKWEYLIFEMYIARCRNASLAPFEIVHSDFSTKTWTGVIVSMVIDGMRIFRYVRNSQLQSMSRLASRNHCNSCQKLWRMTFPLMCLWFQLDDERLTIT